MGSVGTDESRVSVHPGLLLLRLDPPDPPQPGPAPPVRFPRLWDASPAPAARDSGPTPAPTEHWTRRRGRRAGTWGRWPAANFRGWGRDG